MFPRRYFAGRYFAPRYFPQSQGNPPPVQTNFQLIGKHGQVPGAPLGFTNGP